MKSERLELIYEQGTNIKILGIVNFSKLFELMLLISKGEATVKEVTKTLKGDWNLSKKDFDIFFYGKFPSWLHEYLIERWSEYIGKALDREFLTLILEQEICEWEEVFCNETSFYYMLTGMEYLRTQALAYKKYNSMITEMESQLAELEYSNLIESIRLDVLTGITNRGKV